MEKIFFEKGYIEIGKKYKYIFIFENNKAILKSKTLIK